MIRNADDERVGYAVVHYRVLRQLKISPTEYLILEMVYHLSAKNGHCYKSNASIAQDLGMSFNGIKSAIQRLEDRELLVRVENGWRCGPAYLALANTEPVSKISISAKSAQKLRKSQPIAKSSGKNNSKSNRDTAAKAAMHTKLKIDLPDDPVRKAYWRAVHEFGVPSRNDRNTNLKAARLKRELGEAGALKYLDWMVDVYRRLSMPYKPEVVEALDFYSKRAQISQAVKRHKAETAQRRWE